MLEQLDKDCDNTIEIMTPESSKYWLSWLVVATALLPE